MKKLSLIALLITSFTINAQEKQNDATWEETIQFLKENVARLNIKKTSKFNHGGKTYKNTFLSIENNIIKYKWRTTYSWDSEVLGTTRRVNLKHLTGIGISDYGNSDGLVITLGFEKNSVTDNKDGSMSRIYIPLCVYVNDFKCEKNLFELNDKFLKRLETAFKHLAYLANEKRKKSKF